MGFDLIELMVWQETPTFKVTGEMWISAGGALGGAYISLGIGEDP